MNSSVYQLSSDANATNQNDNIFYSKYIIKRLPGEVILDAYSQVTGVPTRIRGLSRRNARAAVAGHAGEVGVPDDVRTAGAPSSAIRPNARPIATIAQALHVINGDTLNKKLSAPDGYVALFLKLGLSDSRILDHVFLTAFSRYPSDAEKAALLSDLKQGTRRQALEDVLWALLTNKEFLFNH